MSLQSDAPKSKVFEGESIISILRSYIADMKKLTPHLLLCFAFLFTNYASAQCAENESSVHIVVDTDGYGYESYWELVPLDQTLN